MTHIQWDARGQNLKVRPISATEADARHHAPMSALSSNADRRTWPHACEGRFDGYLTNNPRGRALLGVDETFTVRAIHEWRQNQHEQPRERGDRRLSDGFDGCCTRTIGRTAAPARRARLSERRCSRQSSDREIHTLDVLESSEAFVLRKRDNRIVGQSDAFRVMIG